jgi:radical SAM superfamily enzyme YgiQ (UPF0313 family)
LKTPERTIHLVNPASERLAYFGKSVAPSLGLAVVGSMAISTIKTEGFREKVNIRLTDEHLRQRLMVRPGDLVLITTLTSIAERARTLGIYTLEEGATVVYGGPEASLRRELFTEGKVFIGEAGNSQVFTNMVKEYLHTGRLGKDTYVSEGVANPRAISLKSLPVDPEIYRTIDSATLLPATFLSLGCPFSCAFCAAQILSGKTIRSRPAEEVIEEIKIRKLQGLNLVDSNPPFSQEWEKFLNLMNQLSLRDGWTVQLSMNFLDGEAGDKLLKELGSAQCQRILVGVESPFAENLEVINKRQNLIEPDIKKQTKHIIQKAHKQGIKVTLLLIVGFPKDDPERIMALADFVDETQADGVNIFILTPLPGTALWKELIEAGLFEPEEIPPEAFDLRHCVWNHPVGREVLQQSYLNLSNTVWSPRRMASRIKRALLIAGPPKSIIQRLKSSVGFELGCRDQHL